MGDYDGIHWGSLDQRVRLIRTHCVCTSEPESTRLSTIGVKGIGNCTGTAHDSKSCIVLVTLPWLPLVTGNVECAPLTSYTCATQGLCKILCVSPSLFSVYSIYFCSSNSWFISHWVQRICFRETQDFTWYLVYPLAGCQETETSLPQVNLRAQLLNLLKSEEALLAAGADDPDGIMSVVFLGSTKTWGKEADGAGLFLIYLKSDKWCMMMYDVFIYIYIHKKNIKKIYGAVSGLRSDRFSIHWG